MLGFGSENDEQMSKKVKIDHQPDMKNICQDAVWIHHRKTKAWNPKNTVGLEDVVI